MITHFAEILTDDNLTTYTIEVSFSRAKGLMILMIITSVWVIDVSSDISYFR